MAESKPEDDLLKGDAGRRHNDIMAGDRFRNSLLPRAEYPLLNTGLVRRNCPMWFGWAIMDAFLAGCDHARGEAQVDALELLYGSKGERLAASYGAGKPKKQKRWWSATAHLVIGDRSEFPATRKVYVEVRVTKKFNLKLRRPFSTATSVSVKRGEVWCVFCDAYSGEEIARQYVGDHMVTGQSFYMQPGGKKCWTSTR